MQNLFVKLKELGEGTRLDAEYYQPDYLRVDKLLRSLDYLPLAEATEYIKSFGAYALCNQVVLVDKGIPFLRCTDIRDGIVDFAQAYQIDEPTHKILSKSEVKPNMVLLTMSGTVGNSAFADPKWNYPINSNQDIAKIKTNDKIDARYLTVFFNSVYGKNQTARLPVGSVQQHIFIWQLKQLLIYLPTTNFQKTIADAYDKANALMTNSEQMYSRAEQLLLAEIGLTDWQTQHKLSFVKNYSDTQSAGRIDAEYFQPMYEDFEALLSRFPRKTLGSICNLINYGTVPTSPYTDAGTPYIKGLNLVGGLIQGELDHLINTDALPNKYYTQENDIIISQMGTAGKAGIVTKEQTKYLFASFTIRARLTDDKYIDPHVLTLYINVIARKWYFSRRIAQASVRQNTDLPTVRGLLVPQITSEIQNKIKSLLLESYDVKAKSKYLLEVAKLGVEMAIETSEKNAQAWLEAQLTSS